MMELPAWARENLPEHITYIKHPIEIGNGDWAIGLIKNRTFLYSRYPFGGKQRIFKWRERLDQFSSSDWSGFIQAVAEWANKEIPREAANLIHDLEQLRRKWIVGQG